MQAMNESYNAVAEELAGSNVVVRLNLLQLNSKCCRAPSTFKLTQQILMTLALVL